MEYVINEKRLPNGRIVKVLPDEEIAKVVTFSPKELERIKQLNIVSISDFFNELFAIYRLMVPDRIAEIKGIHGGSLIGAVLIALYRAGYEHNIYTDLLIPGCYKATDVYHEEEILLGGVTHDKQTDLSLKELLAILIETDNEATRYSTKYFETLVGPLEKDGIKKISDIDDYIDNGMKSPEDVIKVLLKTDSLHAKLIWEKLASLGYDFTVHREPIKGKVSILLNDRIENVFNAKGL